MRVLQEQRSTKRNTYSSWDSPVVTDLSTNQPVNCLNLAERTGCLVLSCLWPYVKDRCFGRVSIWRIGGYTAMSMLAICLDSRPRREAYNHVPQTFLCTVTATVTAPVRPSQAQQQPITSKRLPYALGFQCTALDHVPTSATVSFTTPDA